MSQRFPARRKKPASLANAPPTSTVRDAALAPDVQSGPDLEAVKRTANPAGPALEPQPPPDVESQSGHSLRRIRIYPDSSPSGDDLPAFEHAEQPTTNETSLSQDQAWETPAEHAAHQVPVRSLIRAAIQRQAVADSSTPANLNPVAPAAQTGVNRAAEAGPLIVDDGVVELHPGQMKKSQFLAQLKTAVCATADEALAGTIWSALGCPWIDHWFRYYGNRDSAQIERAIQKYVPQATGIQSAADYIPLICGRVRRSIATWATTGEITGVPEEAATAASAGPVQAAPGVPGGALRLKAEAGVAPGSQNIAWIQARLGAGRPLDSSLRSRMEPSLGQDLSKVRVHTDAVAGKLSEELHARAFTVGSSIAFRSGEYRPDTPIGEALIAHELAHVLQQDDAVLTNSSVDVGVAENAALEEDADRVAVDTVVSLWDRPGGFLKDMRRNALPRLRSGLRLQRCSMARAPDNLSTAAEKAAWISQAMKEDKLGASREIVKVFKSAASPVEFIDIQKNLKSMPELIDYLGDWDAIQVGALGPLVEGAEKLNQKRVDFIVNASHDYGIARAQVFVLFMFNAMFDDDMKWVLRALADDNRMDKSIEQMPEVKKVIAERGISLADYKDRDDTLGDFGRGMGRGLSDFWRSSQVEREKTASRYYSQKSGLPPEYRAVLWEIENRELTEAMTPGNAIIGGIDYLTFGIPSGIYGLVAGTVGGVTDLAQGEYDSAGYQLTGAAMVLCTYLGVKAYRSVTKPGTATVYGPEGPGQFQIKGFEGPIPREVARLGSIVALNSEAQAATGLLLSRYGRPGMVELARYVQADSKAALLVYERGLPAMDALMKAKGDVAKASAILGPKPAGLLPAAPAQSILVVGAETSAEFAYAQEAATKGASVTVVNPRTTTAAKEFQRSGGNFVEGPIENLPRTATFQIIREDYPYPLGRAFPPTLTFVTERLDRLAPGGSWVIVTESAEFAQTIKAAAETKGAKVTSLPIPVHHEGTPKSSYPRESTRITIVVEKE